jgi:hypothetical protein
VRRDPVQQVERWGAARGPRGPARIARRFAALAALALVLAAPGAQAEGRIQKFRGQLGIGYAKLVGDETPGGSFSMSAGVDYPVSGRLRAGVAFGYELLGGRIVERGSFVASLDYSMVEFLALAHWAPSSLGPLRRISLGPGLFGARADLSASAGGAGFGDLAVDEVAPGFALDGTVMQGGDSAVRIGLEVGGRMAFLNDDTWTMALVRLAFHY